MTILDVAMLFCPADRPDRYQKALSASRSVIFDLEDAVSPALRKNARIALMAALNSSPESETVQTTEIIVRVNALASRDGVEDIELIRKTQHRRILVPKAEDPAAISVLDDFEVFALIETLAGLDAVDAIAASPNCVGLMWGGDDFTADLGGRSSRRADGTLLPHAVSLRQSVLLSAKRNNVLAIDGPLLQIDDLSLLEAEAREAACMGFATKAAIHPKQLPSIRSGFRPSEAELSKARRILELAAQVGGGVSRLQGLMIDGPVVRQAQALLDAAFAE